MRTMLIAMSAWMGCTAPPDAARVDANDNNDPAPREIPPLPDEPEIYGIVRDLPGVTLLGATVSRDNVTVLEVAFEQPVDHDDPDGAQFEQRLTLRHRELGAPMVLLTSGYANFYFTEEENLTAGLGANQIAVEKRYHAGSVPAGDIDWTTMDIPQIAADQHRIVEVFSAVYNDGWIGHGGSQGGLDALYHRMLFPDDLDGTVALVAPLMRSLADPRGVSFFTDSVDPACQGRLNAIRTALLTPEADGGLREAVVELAQTITPDLSWTRVGGVDAAVEMFVYEFPFIFWQYDGLAACPDVPSVVNDPDAAMELALRYWGGDGSDENIAEMSPYYYQVSRRNGYPVIDPTGTEGLLSAGWRQPYTFLPEGAEVPTYEPMTGELERWLNEEADGVMLVNGELDPLTPFQAELADPVGDVRLYTVPDGTHLAPITALTRADREAFWAEVETWLP
jgi:hypothetical protein